MNFKIGQVQKNKLQKVSRKGSAWMWRIFRLLMLIGISYVIIYPLMVELSLLFMAKEDVFDLTVKWIPRHYSLSNLQISIALLQYIPSLLKTVGFCLTLSVLQVISCTMAGYGFARFKFRGNGILFGIVILTLIIPPQTYIITLYEHLIYFDVFGIIRLITGQPGIKLLDKGILPFALMSATGTGIKNGLYIYILRQIFRSLPNELEEAGRVDGANSFKIFSQIMLPNAMPTVLVAFLLSFVWQWNDTFYISLFAPEMNLLSVQLQKLIFTVTSYLGGWNTVGDVYTSVLVNTGSFLVILPLLVLFAFCQRFFVEGVERSGIVG